MIASRAAGRWSIAILLFLATVINYIDRQIFAVLAPLFSLELHLTEVQYGFLVQAFLLPYTVMFLVSGYWIDRVGARAGLAACMAWWSAAAALHAVARGFWSLSLFRCLLGAGESGNYTAAPKVVSQWFPPKDRSLATAVYSAGTSVGAIVCPPLAVWLALKVGWRHAFFLTGVAGLVWLLPWFLLYREAQLAESVDSRPAPGLAEFARLFRLRETQALFWPRVISEPLWWFYLFWLPKYLKDIRHFTLTEIGYTLWIPYVAADLGALLGGAASSLLVRRGMLPASARKRIMIPSALAMPAALLLLFSPSSPVTIGVICLGTFAHMAWKVNLLTLTNDLFEESRIASLSGLLAFGSGLGGVIFAGLAGAVVSRYSYGVLFLVISFRICLARWNLLVDCPCLLAADEYAGTCRRKPTPKRSPGWNTK